MKRKKRKKRRQVIDTPAGRLLASRRLGGRMRAASLSPQARVEIARLGYQAMLRKRYLRILEAALFGVVE